jgi:DNA ligase D-like protein (predicted 3'-phosphoesterase)
MNTSAHGSPRFVIQKQAARRLHYDFRLEADGVLWSWAVPKGPAMDPKIKRLAIAVPDHPLEHIDFEGTIGGEYGTGPVIVWDHGTYQNITHDHDDSPVALDRAHARGHILVWLDGEKLHGGFVLIRFRGENLWLLEKMRDEHADEAYDPVRDQPESVLSGKTIEEIGRVLG